MAEFRNRDNELVSVVIDGFDDYVVQSCEIASDDVSGNIFVGIHTTSLSLTILTDNVSIYTGSLIGKSVNLTVGGVSRHYTIVSNTASMPANISKESISIEAVDDLLMLKNVMYEQVGYDEVSNILHGILGDYVLCDGWGGTSDLLSLRVNTGVLYGNGNNTPPTKYDVLESIVKYINRAVAYDYERSMYVLFNGRILTNSVGAMYVTSNGQADGSYTFSNHTLDASTIAISDRSVTLDDPWQSAEVECEFEDVEVSKDKVVYDVHSLDEGTVVINKADYRYANYYGNDSNGSYVLPSGVDFGDLSLSNIQSWVSAGLYGGCLVNMGFKEQSGSDAEGVRSGNEYQMLFGVKNMPTQAPYSLIKKVYDCNIMVTNHPLYLILHDNVIYSNNSLPEDSGEFISYYPFVGYRVVLVWDDGRRTDYNGVPLGTSIGGLSIDSYVGVGLSRTGDARKQRGTAYSTDNNVMWGDHLQSDGHKLRVGGTGYLRRVEVSICPMLWYGESYAGTAVIPSQYEFHQFDMEIEMSADIDESLFETSTIYKWVNDLSQGITINGNEYSDKPKFVTYDGKKAGNNCVLTVGNYVGALSDEQGYYGSKCNSEERAVADMGRQYGRNVFTEVVTTRGVHGPLEKWRDAYFGKNCVVVNTTVDIVNSETNIKLMEVI